MSQERPPIFELPPYDYDSAEALAQALPGLLEPAEVLALDNYLDELSEAHEKWEREHRVELSEDNPSVKLGRFGGTVAESVEFLPAIDGSYAYAVYLAYAQSPIWTNVSNVATKMGALTRVDHDRGFALWMQLIRHSDGEIRYDAFEELGTFDAKAKAGSYEAAEAILTKLGLTWRDARQLLDAYERAQRGEDLYNLGQVALTKLVEVTNTERT